MAILYVNFPRCARPFSFHRKIGGGGFGANWRFSDQKRNAWSFLTVKTRRRRSEDLPFQKFFKAGCVGAAFRIANSRRGSRGHRWAPELGACSPGGEFPESPPSTPFSSFGGGAEAKPGARAQAERGTLDTTRARSSESCIESVQRRSES